MNIAQVVLNLDCGGLEKLVIQLSERLNALGMPTTIVCLDKKGQLAQEAKIKGIPVLCTGKSRGLDVSLIFRLKKIFKSSHIDVVHTHNFSPLIYGSLAAQLARRPCLNSRHGRAAKKAPSFIWNQNDYVVAVSEDARQEMKRHNKIDDHKCRVIYNGIDLRPYNNQPETGQEKTALRKTLGFHQDSFLVGHVARLSPEKDQKSLILALQMLVRKGLAVELMIIGDGPLKNELMKLTADLNLKNHVRFLGFREDVAQLLSCTDVFVLSSTMEGISLTLLEAMAASKPIIATNVGGNPEVVIDRATGLLVDVGAPQQIAQAVEFFYNDRSQIPVMGKAGRTRVEREFNIDQMAQEYIKLYQSMGPKYA